MRRLSVTASVAALVAGLLVGLLSLVSGIPAASADQSSPVVAVATHGTPSSASSAASASSAEDRREAARPLPGRGMGWGSVAGALFILLLVAVLLAGVGVGRQPRRG